MTAANYEQIVEQVKALSPAEQWRLKDLLKIWLAPPVGLMTEDELDRELLKEGVLDYVPPPITDLTPYQNRKLIEVKGKPLSETIIEERR